jgi:hypothetical protein
MWKRQLRPKKSLKLRIELYVKHAILFNSSMKITLLTPALAAILGLALASAPLPIHAQNDTTSTNSTDSKAGAPARAMGTLSAVDTTANTISVENKTDGTRTFSIASTATITKDKKPATLADFAVGDKVFVAYTTDASGTLTATKLSTKTAKAKKSSDSTDSTPSTTTSNQ